MYVELHGEKVREMREATGQGAGTFAKEAGVSEGTLRRAERGLPVQLSTARAERRASAASEAVFLSPLGLFSYKHGSNGIYPLPSNLP